MEAAMALSRLVQICLVLTTCVFARAETTVFALHKVADTNGTGHTALSYLIPKGWQPKDQLVWNLMLQTTPLVYSTEVTSPDGSFTVKYRNVAHSWYTRTPNIGDKGVPPPQNPTDLAVSAYKSIHPDAQIEVVDRSEKAVDSIFRPMPTQTTRAMNCAIEFRATSNGKPSLVKVAFKFDSYDSGTQWGKAHGFSNGEWYVTDWSVISGPESQFAKALRIGSVTLSSMRFDPEFFQQYSEICVFLTQQIAQQGQERLEILRKSYHPISGFNQEKFEQQEASRDRFTRDMCDYALDQQRFTDGTTQFIAPSEYKYAAKNDKGEYLLTNDPTYNKYKDWQELQHLGPGE